MIWFFGTRLEGDRIMCRDSRGETLHGHDSTLLNQIHALGHLFQSNLKRHCMIERALLPKCRLSTPEEKSQPKLTNMEHIEVGESFQQYPVRQYLGSSGHDRLATNLTQGTLSPTMYHRSYQKSNVFFDATMEVTRCIHLHVTTEAI